MKKQIKSHKWISIIYTSLVSIRSFIYKISYRLIAIVYSVCGDWFDSIPIKNVTGIYKIIYTNHDNRGLIINCGLENIGNNKDVVELKGKLHKWLTDASIYSTLFYLKLDFKRGFLTNREYVNSKTLEPCGKELDKIDWPSVLSGKIKVLNLSDYLDTGTLNLKKSMALYNNTDKDYSITINNPSVGYTIGDVLVSGGHPIINWTSYKHTITIN